MARQLLAIEAMTDEDCTFSVGVIEGGRWVNCVPTICRAEAQRHRYVLVPEPARANGGVVTGRYAIARYNLEAEGRPSHAGATLKEGRSAINAMNGPTSRGSTVSWPAASWLCTNSRV